MVARPLTLGVACEGDHVRRLKKEILGLDNERAGGYFTTLSH